METHSKLTAITNPQVVSYDSTGKVTEPSYAPKTIISRSKILEILKSIKETPVKSFDHAGAETLNEIYKLPYFTTNPAEREQDADLSF